MTISYSLSVSNVATSSNSNFTDAVLEVLWVRTGTCSETGRTGEVNGTTKLQMPAADYEGFTAFSDLTEAQVLAWVEADINSDAEKLYDLNRDIQREIDLTELPKHAMSLPWKTD